MKSLLRGKKINHIKIGGKDVVGILQRNKAGYIQSPNGLEMDGLIPTQIRIVTDGGKKWMEVGFTINDGTPITGNPVTGWSIDGGYGFLYLEWRKNESRWETGKFVAAPVPVETLTGEKTYWSRAIHPINAPTATAAELVCESTSDTGDTRNNPITGFVVGGIALSLPNFPYTFPEDAMQLQTDIRAAGFTTATVTATTRTDWRIVLKDLTFGAVRTTQIKFAPYVVEIIKSVAMGRSYLNFKGAILDDNNVEIAPAGFARVGVQAGPRRGNPSLILWEHPPIGFGKMVDDPLEGLEVFTIAYDPLTFIPSIEYPLAPITGDVTPGSVLTRPTYVWPDPGWTSLVIVGTWWKNGVATSEHGATFDDWLANDIITYREIATNENGVSSVNDLSWPKWYTKGKWAKAYADATVGGESKMIRYLDDPDVPSYGYMWMKADKNRFHQERAPGSAKKYIFNPDNWLYAFRDSLTAVSVALEYPFIGNMVPNENWMAKRGVTAITDQHIVSCGHGPPGLGIEGFPSRVRFVGKDGETYEREIVGHKYCFAQFGGVIVNGVSHALDSWIGVLNSPLPAAVQIVRTIPNDFKTAMTGLPWDMLFVCQSMENESNSMLQPQRQRDYYPYNQPDYTQELYHPNYPWRQRSMTTISNYGQKLNYFPWAGDSGMPKFIGLGTELLWAGFTGGGGAGPDFYPVIQDGVTITWEALATQMIVDADSDALVRNPAFNGGIPTGKTIAVAELSELLA